MDLRADLQIHSTQSFDTKVEEGAITPKQIIEMVAREKKVGVVSITDHFKVAQRYRGNVRFAKRRGIELVVGAEFDARIRLPDKDYMTIDVLAYFNPDTNAGDRGVPPPIISIVDMLSRERREACNKIAWGLVDLGYLMEDTVERRQKDYGNQILGKAEIARMLTSPRHACSGKVLGSTEEAWDLMRREFRTLVRQTIDPTDLCNIVRKEGGLTSIAHPGRILGPKGKRLSRGDLTLLIERVKPDAIECYYPYNRMVADINREESATIRIMMIALAESNGLLVTGGSDFHGTKCSRGVSSPGDISLPSQYTRRFLEALHYKI